MKATIEPHQEPRREGTTTSPVRSARRRGRDRARGASDPASRPRRLRTPSSERRQQVPWSGWPTNGDTGELAVRCAGGRCPRAGARASDRPSNTTSACSTSSRANDRSCSCGPPAVPIEVTFTSSRTAASAACPPQGRTHTAPRGAAPRSWIEAPPRRRW
jgi:hypothetical protein